MIKIFCISFIITLYSCGSECIDKKSGLHKSSYTIKESAEKKLFQFEMQSDKIEFNLDSGKLFKIKNAWIENGWTYQCVNNKAVVKKDSFLQFVICGDYNGKNIYTDSLSYLLWEKDGSHGEYLGNNLSYLYSGEDTITLNLKSNKTLIETIHFYKKINIK